MSLFAVLAIPVASLIMLAALSAFEKKTAARLDNYNHYKLSALVPEEFPGDDMIRG